MLFLHWWSETIDFALASHKPESDSSNGSNKGKDTDYTADASPFAACPTLALEPLALFDVRQS